MAYNIKSGNANISQTYPTGSIVAIVGSSAGTDPNGWVICNGLPRNDNTYGKYNKLSNMSIGSGGSGTSSYTPPDLDGAFLRGTGTSSLNAIYVGPSLKTFDEQKIPLHRHHTYNHAHNPIKDTGTLSNVVALGVYTGTATEAARDLIYFTQTTGMNVVSSTGINLLSQRTSSNSISSSTSSVTNSTAGVETRPYNYGVVWILKL